jgi:hypothetical protein
MQFQGQILTKFDSPESVTSERRCFKDVGAKQCTEVMFHEWFLHTSSCNNCWEM